MISAINSTQKSTLQRNVLPTQKTNNSPSLPKHQLAANPSFTSMSLPKIAGITVGGVALSYGVYEGLGALWTAMTPEQHVAAVIIGLGVSIVGAAIKFTRH